jgi:hypothetical protein
MTKEEVALRGLSPQTEKSYLYALRLFLCYYYECYEIIQSYAQLCFYERSDRLRYLGVFHAPNFG